MKKWIITTSEAKDTIPNTLHVERNDAICDGDYDDYAAADDAMRDGVKLINDIEGIYQNFYLDTPENRKVIMEYLKNNTTEERKYIMNTTKTYENLTVTVSCTEHDDFEMLETIQRFKDSVDVKKNAEEYYRPRLETVGQAKFEAIVKQMMSLVDIFNQVKQTAHSSQNPLWAKYTREDTGETCRLSYKYYEYKRGYYFSDGENNLICSLANKDSEELKRLINDKDGWIAKWDEYGIYNKMRSSLLKYIKEITATNINQKNALIETYQEYVEE